MPGIWCWWSALCGRKERSVHQWEQRAGRDTELAPTLWPDEVDVIVEAAAEASCRHLVQPQNWLIWICNPARREEVNVLTPLSWDRKRMKTWLQLNTATPSACQIDFKISRGLVWSRKNWQHQVMIFQTAELFPSTSRITSLSWVPWGTTAAFWTFFWDTSVHQKYETRCKVNWTVHTRLPWKDGGAGWQLTRSKTPMLCMFLNWHCEYTLFNDYNLFKRLINERLCTACS